MIKIDSGKASNKTAEQRKKSCKFVKTFLNMTAGMFLDQKSRKESALQTLQSRHRYDTH